ncbi:ABC transporter permease [Nocardia huaxiensis]|uniref:ABC transporter permease n=1 Tax=Nocardia huaxiensis TaxID=2755382 RepID=A0A7D6VCC3_9NOCA|nr:ABC transporter permease [Nocardia huaxiensis]QLY30902.1 ABC transporter permease [Nocardia huaxiensis]UFS94413.1 ABC transporter permease [Nocardia huaxiensis]
MNPTTVAVRAGLRRGLIELRQNFTNGMDLFGQLFWPVGVMVALYLMRNGTFEASGLGLGALALPGVLGMLIAFNGLFGMAQYLAVDREDGTLLRAKATPNGMRGYLIGKIVLTAGTVFAPLVLLLVFGMAVIGGVELNSVSHWLTFIWVLLLGLVASLPLGAVIGSLFESPRSIGFMSFPIMGLVAISGIFYPITSMPGWLQGLGQVFPIYWLGLGMRSAMMPDSAAAVEIAGSWRHLETAAVLGVWAVLGLALAPILLRRMARRESGSNVAARREKAMQRAF